MNEIKAVSASDLINQVGRMIYPVKERGLGRTKDQTEDWVRRTILSGQARSNYFSFPMRAVPNDRPDLDLFFPIGSVGVEISESVPIAYAAAVAYANQNFPDAVVDRSMFSWDQQPMSKKEHAEFFKRFGDKLHGDGWAGDSVEREWADALFHTVEKKIEDLNKSGFREFPEYWLAIYDNFEGPILDLDIATPILAEKIASLPLKQRNYARFLIETGGLLLCIEKDGTASETAISREDVGG